MKNLSSLISTILIVSPFFAQIIDSVEMRAALVFLVIIYLWLSERIPLAMTGMLVPCYAVSAGILTTVEAFQSFGDQVLFLFIGSFILAQGMSKHGLDQWLAKFLMGPLRPAPVEILGNQL